MGFNKRILSIDNIKTIYQIGGYQEVHDYIIKPDVLYCNGCGDIVDIIMGGSCLTTKEQKLKQILYGK